MNIFFLDSDPIVAATYLCDQHANKMIVESLQLLFTTARQTMSEAGLQYVDNNNYLKATHLNHGCRLWLTESSDNIYWLLKYTNKLLSLFESRTQKHHANYRDFKYITTGYYFQEFKNNGFTTPYLAVYDKLKPIEESVTIDKAVEIYREYYCNKVFKHRSESKVKDGLRLKYTRPTWNYNGKPFWYQPKLNIRPNWLSPSDDVMEVSIN